MSGSTLRRWTAVPLLGLMLGAGGGDTETLVLGELAERPYDVALYRRLYDSAAQRLDGAETQLHWGKWMHWSADYRGDRETARALGEELGAIYEGWDADGRLVEEWRGSVLDAVDEATRAKRYRLAGHFLAKLLDLDPADAELLAEFDRLYDKAGEGATGGAFTAERVRRRSPGWIALQNRKHSDWEEAFSRRTKHYKLVTNVSYEFYETVSVVMEDMFDFYQDTYDYKRSAPTVTLAVHRKRSDFDRYCLEVLGTSLSLGVGGWFFDKEMTVAAYDRTESGQDLTDLYRVLFHEASHQFMYLLTQKKTKQDPPTWLNEGTASYFEGCELKSDGSIVKNKPALGRVREWEHFEKSDRRHGLKDLLLCAHRAYDVSFYSYGWSLVYFLNNYEDEAGELVYRKPYLKYLKSFTKKGPRDDSERQQLAFERAVEYFVEDVADPDVPDFEAFEKRWRTFTQGVVADSKKGEEFATELQQRCARYLERGDHERALILAEQADDRRPDDAETCRLLALASEGLRREDDATFWMTRCWELSLGAGEDEAARAAQAWLAENDAESVAELYCGATRRLLASTEEAMISAARAGFPSLSLLFASHAVRAGGMEPPSLADQVRAIRAVCEEDLRLWQRAFDKGADGNRNWGGVDVVRYEHDGVIVNNPTDMGKPTEPCEVPSLQALRAPLDVRGTVQVEGDGSAYLLFGIGRNGRPRAAISFRAAPAAPIVALETADTAVDLESGASSTSYAVAKKSSVEPGDSIPFELRVRHDGGEIVCGETIIPFPASWDPERFEGRMALTVEDGTIALFSKVEVRPGDAFWPVPPAD